MDAPKAEGLGQLPLEGDAGGNQATEQPMNRKGRCSCCKTYGKNVNGCSCIGGRSHICCNPGVTHDPAFPLCLTEVRQANRRFVRAGLAISTDHGTCRICSQRICPGMMVSALDAASSYDDPLEWREWTHYICSRRRDLGCAAAEALYQSQMTRRRAGELYAGCHDE